MDPEVDKASIVTLACSWESRLSISSHVVEEKPAKPVNRAKAMRAAATRTALRALAKHHDAPSLRTLAPPANTLLNALQIVEAARLRGDTELDLSAVPLGADDLIGLCDAIADLPQIESVNLESLATPKSLARHVHRHLLGLVAACPRLTEVILSDACKLSAAQESEINAMLEANAAALAAKEKKAAEREERRLERERRRIPDDVIDFLHWENSNRVAIMTLCQRERKRLMEHAVREHSRILQQQQRAANHQQQFEARVRFGEAELADRWDIAMIEDEEFASLEVCEMAALESAARATLVSQVRRVLESFQVAKVEDYIKAKERLKYRLTIQRQQRQIMIGERRRMAVALRAEATAFWFAVHVRINSLNVLAKKHREQAAAALEAEEQERRAEAIRKQQIEAHEQARVDNATKKIEQRHREQRAAVWQSEETDRDAIYSDHDTDAQILSETFTTLRSLHEVETLRIAKQRDVAAALEAFFPKFALHSAPTNPCHYEGGAPTQLFRDVALVPDSDGYARCYDKTRVALRDYEGLLPKYRSAAEMIEFRRSLQLCMSLQNQLRPVAPMPDAAKLDELMAVAGTMQPGTKVVVKASGSSGDDSVNVLTLARDASPQSDDAILSNDLSIAGGARNPLLVGRPEDCSARIAELLAVDGEGSDTLTITLKQPLPYEHFGCVLELVRYRVRGTVHDTALLNVKADVSINFGAAGIDLVVARTIKRQTTIATACFVGKCTITAAPPPREPPQCHEYLSVNKAKLFADVRVGQPLTGVDEASIRGPYRVMVADIERGFGRTDMICLLSSPTLRFEPVSRRVYFEGAVVAEVTKGRLFAPTEATQATSNSLIGHGSRIELLLGTICEVNVVDEIVSNLAFVTRNPAPLEGEREISVGLADFSGGVQRIRAKVHVVRVKAETTLTLATTSRSFVLQRDFGEFGPNYLSPYTFLFADSVLENADTDHFIGGELVVRCMNGDSNDTIGVALTTVQNAMVTHLAAPPETPGNFAMSGEGRSRSGTPTNEVFTIVDGGDALATAVSTPKSGAATTGAPPVDRASVSAEGLITFGGNEIGIIERGAIFRPPNGDPSAAVRLVTAPGSPAPLGALGAATLHVVFSRSGTCTMRGVKALLNSICYFSTTADVASVRKAVLELRLGPSLGKVNEDGVVVLPYTTPSTANLPADDTALPLTATASVSVRVLPPLFMPRSADTTMIYKERSGLVRLPPHDVSSALEQWPANPGAVLTVEMLPAHRCDIFTFHSHDIELVPLAGGGAGGVGRSSTMTLMTPGASGSDRSPPPSRGASRTRLQSVTHLHGGYSSSSGAGSSGRLQRRASHQPLRTPTSALVTFGGPGGNSSDDQFVTKKVDDDVESVVSSDDGGGEEVPEDGGDELRRLRSGASSLTATPRDGGMSLGRITRSQSLATHSIGASEGRKIIEGVIEAHRAREAREQTQRIARGYDARLGFDALAPTATTATISMRILSKDGAPLGTLHAQPGKTQLRLGQVTKRDVGVLLRSLSFANYGESLTSVKRAMRVVLSDGVSSFSQVVTPVTVEGIEPTPTLSLLSNRITARIGNSYLATPVGALCIVPEGRGMIAYPRPLVSNVSVAFSLPSGDGAQRGDSLAFLTSEQQQRQHERADMEALRVGPRFGNALRCELPSQYTLHFEAADAVDVDGGSPAATAILIRDHHRARIGSASVTDKSIAMSFGPDVPTSLVSYAINCVALRHAETDAAGVREVKIAVAQPGTKPSTTTVQVEILEPLITPVPISGSTPSASPSAPPPLRPLSLTTTAPVVATELGEIAIYSDGRSIVSLANRIRVAPKLTTTPTLLLINVSETATDEHTAELDFDAKASSQLLKVKKGLLHIRGSNCGKLFLTRRRLRLEPTSLLTAPLLADLLNGLVVKLDPSAACEPKRVSVQIHDDADVPCEVRICVVPPPRMAHLSDGMGGGSSGAASPRDDGHHPPPSMLNQTMRPSNSGSGFGTNSDTLTFPVPSEPASPVQPQASEEAAAPPPSGMTVT